jgi:hypothetical protein
MTESRLRIRALLDRVGGHPARALGLDLDHPSDRTRWFVAACLLAGRAGEKRALAAFRALDRAQSASLDQLDGADPQRLCAALEDAQLPRPEAVAGRLKRAARRLAEAHGGSLEALAADADDLEDLGSRLAGLASGVGAATVLRFLRPLRDRWPAAREVPLAPAARAAAQHLGLLGAGEDAAGEPAALRAALRGSGDPVALADLEAALERLGARACLRDRPERCPLGEACPARAGGTD